MNNKFHALQMLSIAEILSDIFAHTFFFPSHLNICEFFFRVLEINIQYSAKCIEYTICSYSFIFYDFQIEIFE